MFPFSYVGKKVVFGKDVIAGNYVNMIQVVQSRVPPATSVSLGPLWREHTKVTMADLRTLSTMTQGGVNLLSHQVDTSETSTSLQDCSERMCYSFDSTEYLVNDLACLKMTPRSRAVMQQRAETLDDTQIREFLELRAERVHLQKTSTRAQLQEQCDGVGEEFGVVTSAAKVNRCSGDKLSTPYGCIAASSLTSHPSLTHSVSGVVKMRAKRTHLCNLSNRAKAEEECDGEIKEYEVATSAAKAQRCSQVKLATTYACNAAAALSSHPSSAVLTPVSILRTTKRCFPQHALVVSDTFDLNRRTKHTNVLFHGRHHRVRGCPMCVQLK